MAGDERAQHVAAVSCQHHPVGDQERLVRGVGQQPQGDGGMRGLTNLAPVNDRTPRNRGRGSRRVQPTGCLRTRLSRRSKTEPVSTLRFGRVVRPPRCRGSTGEDQVPDLDERSSASGLQAALRTTRGEVENSSDEGPQGPSSSSRSVIVEALVRPWHVGGRADILGLSSSSGRDQNFRMMRAPR